ncbi:MAG TPA: ECF transporter S component [Clostridiales bacterium]|nr:ECF transporter S component [Clostridiales bacterium]
MYSERARTIFSVRKLVITGMLAGVSILLGSTPLGFIPVGPTKATIMHLPVIIGAIMEGPVVAVGIGLIFGVFSMIQAVMAPTVISFVFLNPLVAVLPRVLIGITAYYTYKATKSAAASAAVGTLTNTVGVLGMIYVLYGAQFAAAMGQDQTKAAALLLGIATTNGIPEVIVAVVVVTAVVSALKRIRKL